MTPNMRPDPNMDVNLDAEAPDIDEEKGGLSGNSVTLSSNGN